MSDQTNGTTSSESPNLDTHPFSKFLPDVDPATFPRIHPAANYFPMLDPEEMQALAASIKANGQKNPILMYQGGSKGHLEKAVLLDGRNRWVAAILAGVPPYKQHKDKRTLGS